MFVSVLGESPDLNVIPDKDGAGWMIAEPIAYCCETNRLVSVDSRLVPTNCIGIHCWEFSFEISVLSEDGTEESFATQDREIAKGFIPDDMRARILAIVCQSCRKPLEAERPETLYRVTKGRGLPEKALKKHEILTAAGQSLGYVVDQTGTDAAGRMFWLMSRTAY